MVNGGFITLLIGWLGFGMPQHTKPLIKSAG